MMVELDKLTNNELAFLCISVERYVERGWPGGNSEFSREAKLLGQKIYKEFDRRGLKLEDFYFD